MNIEDSIEYQKGRVKIIEDTLKCFKFAPENTTINITLYIKDVELLLKMLNRKDSSG